MSAAKELSVTELIESLGFFKNFPPDLIQKLGAISCEVSFKKTEVILKQGQDNSYLYFLMSGRVSISVDGGVVAHLDQHGDLLGEMSVISHGTITATIEAETDVSLLRIDSDLLKNLLGEDAEKIEHALYRIYAMILVEKLRVTNDKAKHFEELSSELKVAQNEMVAVNVNLEKKIEDRTQNLIKKTDELEQQNEALMASHKKIEELYATRDVTFSKLQDLYSNFLPPLQSSVQDLLKKAGVKQKRELQVLEREIKGSLKLLKPITELFSSEKALRSKHVLLAEPSKKQQVIAKMALGGTGVHLAIASNKQEVEAALAEKEWDLMFVDTGMLSLTIKAKEKYPNMDIVLMTSEPIPEYLSELAKLPFMPTVVSRDDQDRTFTIKNIMTTVSKLTGHDVFGIEKYLAWGVETQELVIKNSSERGQLLDDMSEYFKDLGMRRSNRERSRGVVEELLMNAIYDAPVDEHGKALYNHLERTECVELPTEQQGLLRFATDGVLMAVSVSDPFGGLTGDVVLNYLESCYSGQAGIYNREKGGAGRGLHQIIENSDLVVFNVEHGVKTEVICLFNVDPKDVGEKSPSFHFFFK